HEARGGVLERLDAVVGVAAVLGLADLLGHHAPDAVGRHAVVLADAEVEERTLGMLGQRAPLRALDLLELVDLRALAVARAADARGEELLEVRVGRHVVLLRWAARRGNGACCAGAWGVRATREGRRRA